MVFSKGDTLRIKDTDETGYVLDEFHNDEENLHVVVMGGMGPELEYVPIDEVELVERDANEKLLNVLCDLALTVKVSSNAVDELVDMLSPRCEGCGEKLHSEDMDTAEEDDGDDSGQNMLN